MWKKNWVTCYLACIMCRLYTDVADTSHLLHEVGSYHMINNLQLLEPVYNYSQETKKLSTMSHNTWQSKIDLQEKIQKKKY